MSKTAMTECSKLLDETIGLCHLDLGDLDLFGIWCMGFGAFGLGPEPDVREQVRKSLESSS